MLNEDYKEILHAFIEGNVELIIYKETTGRDKDRLDAEVIRTKFQS